MKSSQLRALPVFRFERLGHYPLVHGVTTRETCLPGEGDINIAGGLPREAAIANRSLWASLIGVDANAIVSGRQVHGNRVQIVDEEYAGRGALLIEEAIPDTDALATQSIGLPLLIYTADCVSVIVYDPVEHALGLAHAGWRGTVADVGGALVAAMRGAFGCDPMNLVVGIGPSIGPCCYEVGDEVIDAWVALGLDAGRQAVTRLDRRFHLNLWRANGLAFETAGVPANQIEYSGICTRCHADRFFSRRAGGGHRGLFATVAALSSRPIPSSMQ